MNPPAPSALPAEPLRSPYFREEHELLRRQVRRFVETEVKPFAHAWEEQGFVPREVLRRMGELGFFGIVIRRNTAAASSTRSARWCSPKSSAARRSAASR